MRVFEKLSVTIRLCSHIDIICICLQPREVMLERLKNTSMKQEARSRAHLARRSDGSQAMPEAIHKGRMSARRDYARCRGSRHSCPAWEERNCGDAAIKWNILAQAAL